MAASIVITGLPANDPVPGAYIDIQFAQGQVAGSGSLHSVLLMGNRTTAGTATVDTTLYGPDTAVPCQSEEDVIGLFGAGSELHRMWRRFTAVNRDTTLYLLAVTESPGAAATGTITLAPTPTAGGMLRLWVVDEFVDVPIGTGDTPTAVATDAVTKINAMTHWPVTAANAAGVITLTAKQKGLRGNLVRYQAAVLGSGVAMTATTAAARLAGGTTADSNTVALGTIAPKRYYYIVSAAEDATQFGAVVAQVNSQAMPTTGIRQRAFAGSLDSVANAITVAVGRNAARGEIVWQLGSDWTPAELAANHGAVVALYEAGQMPRPRHNFTGFGNDAVTQASWRVPAPRSGVAPTRAEIKAALMNGVSPIASNANGTTYMVDRITTRSLSGATADYRIRDAHKVTVCDFFGDDVLAKTVLQCSGMDIADDAPEGAPIPGPNVLTPSRYKSLVFSVINYHAANDQLQNVDQIKADTVVQREVSPATRMTARVPLQPIDAAKQFGVVIPQVA